MANRPSKDGSSAGSASAGSASASTGGGSAGARPAGTGGETAGVREAAAREGACCDAGERTAVGREKNPALHSTAMPAATPARLTSQGRTRTASPSRARATAYWVTSSSVSVLVA